VFTGTRRTPSGLLPAEGIVIWADPADAPAEGAPIRSGRRFPAPGWSPSLSLGLGVAEPPRFALETLSDPRRRPAIGAPDSGRLGRAWDGPACRLLFGGRVCILTGPNRAAAGRPGGFSLYSPQLPWIDYSGRRAER
jgi:hypothetical protein